MRDYPTLNVELLDQCVEWVQKQESLFQQGLPSEWFQGFWHMDIPLVGGHGSQSRIDKMAKHGCGTAYCVAGYVAGVVDGHDLNGGMITDIKTDGDDYEVVAFYAGDRLGLTPTEEDLLFLATNTADDIARIAEDIKAGKYRHGGVGS